MKELQILMNDITEWSDATFGDGQKNPAIVYHLRKEVSELIESFEHFELMKNDEAITVDECVKQIEVIKMEFADCFILLVESAFYFGLDAEILISLARRKLEVNKKRKWGKPDKNGVIEHIPD